MKSRRKGSPMSLSAANQARLQKALDTTYRFDGHTDHPIFCTLKEYLDEHAVSFSTGSVRKYTWEYIKRKQEREKLSNAEIEALENERKTTYQACFKDESFLDIPKMIYEYYVNELGKPVENR